MLLVLVAIIAVIESVIAFAIDADVAGYCTLAGLDLIAMTVISQNFKSSTALTVCNLYFVSLLACLVSAAVSLSYSQGSTEYSAYLAIFNAQHSVAVSITVLTMLIAMGGTVVNGIRKLGDSRIVRLFSIMASMGLIT